MPDRLYDPRFQISDAVGAPVSGALIYTYAAGTSTPLATYSDAALTVANANPIVCDSSGRVPETFLGNSSYRVIVKTPAGVTIYTADPINAISAPASAGFRNVLINGNFNINQRAYVSGVATVAANQYTLDRWRVVTSGQNLAFVASGNGNIITAPAGGVEQVVEGANIFGGTYVLNWIGTATATVAGTARAKGETFTIAANTNTTVQFANGTVSQAQLEISNVVTAFESRHYGAELLLCQRHYQILRISGGFTSAGAAGYVSYPVNWTCPMRATPTFAAVTTITNTNVSAEAFTEATAYGARYSVTATAAGTTIFVQDKSLTAEL